MDDALRLDHHLDVFVIHIEQPVGLHDLKALVDHGGGIDSDLLSHAPVRMLQSILQRYLLQFCRRVIPEGTAGSRQQDLRDAVLFVSPKTLEDRGVF